MDVECSIEQPYKPSLLARLRWFRERLISRQKIAGWVFWIWRRLASEGNSNLVKHAELEFRVLGWPGDEEIQEWVCENVLDLLKVFASQRHSGNSAPYVLNVFKKLVWFDPIGPLTGKDDEWSEPYDDDGTQQNRRCGDVFRWNDGQAYWRQGRVFREPNGSCYASRDSRVDIDFPWTKPDKPEYVDVEELGN